MRQVSNSIEAYGLIEAVHDTDTDTDTEVWCSSGLCSQPTVFHHDAGGPIMWVPCRCALRGPLCWRPCLHRRIPQQVCRSRSAAELWQVPLWSVPSRVGKQQHSLTWLRSLDPQEVYQPETLDGGSKLRCARCLRLHMTISCKEGGRKVYLTWHRNNWLKGNVKNGNFQRSAISTRTPGDLR